METVRIEVQEITVLPGRFREANPKKVEEITESIVRFGQLQPIIIDRENNLIDGLHRLTALKAGNFTVVDAVYQDDVDDTLRKEIELEVNIQRQEMTWQEQQKAIATLHRLRVARDPNTGQRETAVVAGVDQRSVSQALLISSMMEEFPEVAKAKTKSQALNIINTRARQAKRVLDLREKVVDFSDIESKLWLGDSVDLIKDVPAESIHAIITDPPFGIDYDARVAGTIGETNSYVDDKDSYERLLSMAPDLYRVLKPDGWFVWFLGITWYERAKTVFRKAGFTIDEVPLIWDRSEGRTFTNRPDRYFTKAYDIALYGFKGDAKLAVQGKANIIRAVPVSTSDRELLVERPIELYAELIKRMTVKGETVADFFTGSGSCLAAAASLERDFFGIELSEERRAYALKKIRAHMPTK